MKISDYRISPVGYTYILFIIATLYLLCLLNQRSIEITSLLNGFVLTIYQNHTATNYMKGCDGLWSCSKLLCQTELIRQKLYPDKSYLRLDYFTDGNCYAEDWSWLVQWRLSETAIILLIIAIFIELLALLLNIFKRLIDKLCNRYNFSIKISLILRCLAYVLLLIAYILSLAWFKFMNNSLGDNQPTIIEDWNVIISVFILLANLWSLIPEPKVTFEYTEI